MTLVHNRPKSQTWLGIALLTAALLSILFVATGATLWHQDSPGTVCSICYAAHLPALRSVPAQTPFASDLIVWRVAFELLLTHAAPEILSSAPRGPPV